LSKIINDPVHGFIQVKFELAQKCIDHPYFQRLRNISQLGLTHFVYPGAVHSRFHHALGAFHLMQVAVDRLRDKEVQISSEEEEAACIAILLHDIGHGPYSHALERSFFKRISHEQISLELMQRLNSEFRGKLDLAIQIFNNQYHRKFFYQLISSQLDVDRLDYLKRDSFYSGVVEGNIGVDRLLAMIDVRDNQIVIEEKGIMSVQHFLLSRNLMYWQVYLHKTVMSAEFMLVKLFERIHELNEAALSITSSNTRLNYFFNLPEAEKAIISDEIISQFIAIDDSDVWQLVKELTTSSDEVLAMLATRIISRNFYKVKSSKDIFEGAIGKFKYIDSTLQPYFFFQDSITMTAYTEINPILILTKSGEVISYQEYILNVGNIIPLENKTKKEFYYCLN
jgi:uncharacterized protein